MESAPAFTGAEVSTRLKSGGGFATVGSVKFTCNLSARRCNLGEPLEQSANGDEIELEVDEPHKDLAERVAVNLRYHLKFAGKTVAVTVKTRGTVSEAARQENAQRAAQL